MDDFLTPALFNGVGVLTILVATYWMLATGRLVTRREADAYERRAKAAEDRLAAADARADELVAQNSELMEMARFGRHVFDALREGAQQP